MNGGLPEYKFEDSSLHKWNSLIIGGHIMGQRDTITNENSDGPIACKLYIDEGNPFIGYGYSKKQGAHGGGGSSLWLSQKTICFIR